MPSRVHPAETRVNPTGAGRAAHTAAPLPPRRAAPPELPPPRPRPRAGVQQVRPQLPGGTCPGAPAPPRPFPSRRAPHLPQRRPLLKGGHPAGSSRHRGRAAPPINVAPPVPAERPTPVSPPRSFKVPPRSPAAAFNPPPASPRGPAAGQDPARSSERPLEPQDIIPASLLRDSPACGDPSLHYKSPHELQDPPTLQDPQCITGSLHAFQEAP